MKLKRVWSKRVTPTLFFFTMLNGFRIIKTLIIFVFAAFVLQERFFFTFFLGKSGGSAGRSMHWLLANKILDVYGFIMVNDGYSLHRVRHEWCIIPATLTELYNQ